MRDIMNISINKRVAICLAYAEHTLNYFENEFKDGDYHQAFEQFRNIINIGYEWLSGSNIDWGLLYNLCNDDERDYGCFNFIATFECSDKYETPISVLIWTIYYLIYQCAHSSSEKYFPQDLWGGHLPQEEEQSIIETLHIAVNKYLSAENCEKLKLIEEKYRRPLA
ncbi:Imm6 family immunity protein [Metabacillus fastidiosus]|uniref:Imm6 family immunity protein n=1 Tax=Metabacillus fastidiosus TaxID=1458 RepID=UPI002E1E4241|nr:Imm6 family immunity protein [Metabacillus fastidiosus]